MTLLCHSSYLQYNAHPLNGQVLYHILSLNLVLGLLIFVDDFSSDKTYNVIKEFSEHDSNIKVVKNSSPGKVSGTNLALKFIIRASRL
jgi:glycosyltransferase involved in cell wall biosynthesis